MKPTVVDHATYQAFVIDQLRKHYAGGILVLLNRDWPVILKCLITDLSSLTSLIRDRYHDKGPEPRDPASILRSYLLFLLVRPEIGLTQWVDEMKRVPLYAILSGFEPGQVPGVGTFYDFFPRIWDAELYPFFESGFHLELRTTFSSSNTRIFSSSPLLNSESLSNFNYHFLV